MHEQLIGGEGARGQGKGGGNLVEALGLHATQHRNVCSDTEVVYLPVDSVLSSMGQDRECQADYTLGSLVT